MCFLSDFSIEKQLSQTLEVEAVDQPIFFFKTLTTGWFSSHYLKKFIVKFQEKSPTTLRSSSSVLIGESQNPTDRRTSTAVDADAKQGENFTWPKRKIFSNNISGLLPVTQVKRLQITEKPEIDLARIPSDDHHRMGDGDLHAVQVISWALFVLSVFFLISHDRSDSGLLKGSESFVKKRWRQTR